MQKLTIFSQWVGKTFAVWALLFAVLGFFMPSVFIGLKSWIVPVLALIMFGMGLTLKASDFSEILTRPFQVLLGLLAQFSIMPLLAILLSKLFMLDPAMALGVVLVGCCPGGTSSNVITFLAKGDVALSVTITSISTLLAPVLTPILLALLADKSVDIAVGAMMWSIVKMVLVPIVAGVIINALFAPKVERVVGVLPLVSVAGIVLIIAIVVSASKGKIASMGVVVLAVVILHNLLGYLLGFLLARALGFTLAQQRAIMIEVGMQNSGLGAALASKYFDPVVALPSAIFSVWHNISGALLANLSNALDRKKFDTSK